MCEFQDQTTKHQIKNVKGKLDGNQILYNEDGTIASFLPTEKGIPVSVTKEIEMDVTNTYYPMKPVVPYIKVTQDRVVLEIQRGCIRGCRFCQPLRVLNIQDIKA